MTISYSLVPIPLWYFAQNDGKPLGGGYMKTFRSLDQITPKPIYSDAGGVNPWPNPVFFNANGEAPGPFFWAFDSSNPNEAYFIEVFDANNGLLFTMNNYGPGIAGGGGGGTVTTNVSLDNFIVNNNFSIQGGTSFSGSGKNQFTSITSGQVIAPSNHHGLVKFAPSNPGVSSVVPFAGPDIMYLQNGTGTQDLTFETADFNAGIVPLTGDVTPEYYIRTVCSAAGTSTLKCVQFPIDLHVKNLEQQQLTLMVWIKSNTTTPNVTANFVQYFGSDAATVPAVTSFPIGASPVTNSWVCYIGTITNTPSVSGKTLGAGGDDATYLQICYPTGVTFDISFTKPKIYLGQIPTVFKEIQTYDQIDRIVNSPRTGDVKLTYDTKIDGWVSANDGTIGDASSGASTRANIDTWPLYSLLWNGVLDHWAPVITGRGASAIADFSAHKKLTLTRALGRVLAGVNPSTIIPQNFTKTDYVSGPEHFTLTVADSSLFPTGTPVQLTTSGGGALPAALAINTVYYVINKSPTTIQLAISIDNAYANTPFDVGGNATPTCTVQTALGALIGESRHTMLGTELATHSHTIPQSFGSSNAASGSGVNAASAGTENTGDAGDSTPFNVIQPTTMLNIFYKL